MNAPLAPIDAPLIAVVGCDGSGKSTLTQALQAWLEARQPTATCHLGKQSGNVGRALARLPLFGHRIDKAIVTRTRKAQGRKGPGLLAALVIYAFALRRGRRFSRMLALRHEGCTIIADRFPQIDLPGAIDGPGLNSARATGPIGALARSEEKLFGRMVAYRPDLVLRLNVPLDVAAARKPDHRLVSLARKVDEVPRLRFGGAPIVELDARESAGRVLICAQTAILAMLAERDAVRARAAA